ncbi:MAG: 50S ribosomal protein L19e [Promethearchaeota archaeon]
MTDIKAQRRIAAKLLGVGVNRIWIDDQAIDEVSYALRRDDVRKLIADRVIQTRRIKGVSRSRARAIAHQKKRGQMKGQGRRKGKAGARSPPKRAWMKKVRAQRRYLKALREEESITPKQYRELYLKAKGGAFRNVGHLRHTITERGILKPKRRRREY